MSHVFGAWSSGAERPTFNGNKDCCQGNRDRYHGDQGLNGNHGWSQFGGPPPHRKKLGCVGRASLQYNIDMYIIQRCLQPLPHRKSWRAGVGWRLYNLRASKVWGVQYAPLLSNKRFKNQRCTGCSRKIFTSLKKYFYRESTSRNFFTYPYSSYQALAMTCHPKTKLWGGTTQLF